MVAFFVRLRVRLALWIMPDLCDSDQCLLLGEHRSSKGVCTRCGLQDPVYF